VDRDGNIFEIFPPECWAYHIGLKGRSDIERRSIGIEIASEGALCSDDAGRLYCFDRVSYATRYTGPVFDFGAGYRGYRYFAQYTPAALASVSALVDRLLTVYSIPRQTPADHTRGAVAYADYRGVLAHCHLREDKTDVHPGFAWDELVANCQLELSGTRAAVAAAGVR
jgi:N-acetyl-anhydromuramyl-L-alanine amidase AmpD